MSDTPTTPAYRSLETQVGGHPGVMASEDGSLIIKPCLPKERAFYESLTQEPQLAHLRPFVPKFYGVLNLKGELKEEARAPDVDLSAVLEEAINPPPDHEDKESIVLENISYYFEKPNVLDIKLGTVLYDESASPEKKQRMIDTARATTSLETGVRLTGFTVYDHSSLTPVVTPKSYGKSIKPADLPDGFRRFFPLAPNTEKPAGQGLPRPLLVAIMKGILDDLRAIREAIAETEMRMVGGSLLIVYEAAWEKAKDALKRPRPGALESVDEDDEVEEDEGEDEEDEEGISLPYAIKLIDFAHTKLVPGEGPDQGVLKGIDTTIALFEGRIKEADSENQS